MTDYKKLKVWEKSIELCTSIYKLTECFPEGERFALTDQMRRAAISIPSNIAEGSKRSGDKEFSHFLRIAHGSGAELETQLIIARNLSYYSTETLSIYLTSLDEVMKMLGSLLQKIGR